MARGADENVRSESDQLLPPSRAAGQSRPVCAAVVDETAPPLPPAAQPQLTRPKSHRAVSGPGRILARAQSSRAAALHSRRSQPVKAADRLPTSSGAPVACAQQSLQPLPCQHRSGSDAKLVPPPTASSRDDGDDDDNDNDEEDDRAVVGGRFTVQPCLKRAQSHRDIYPRSLAHTAAQLPPHTTPRLQVRFASGTDDNAVDDAIEDSIDNDIEDRHPQSDHYNQNEQRRRQGEDSEKPVAYSGLLTVGADSIKRSKDRLQHRDEESGKEEAEEEDEWVDASGSATPNHSRIPSTASDHFTDAAVLRATYMRSAAIEPSLRQAYEQSMYGPGPHFQLTNPELATSRLVKRSQSYSYPTSPVLSGNMAPTQIIGIRPVTYRNGSEITSIEYNTPPPLSRGQLISIDSQSGEITSRFVSSGPDSQGSSNRSLIPSASSLSRSYSTRDGDVAGDHESDLDLGAERAMAPVVGAVTATPDTAPAMAPLAARRVVPPPDKYRTQIKLELQRASSVIELTPPVSGPAGATGIGPLVGMGIMGGLVGYDDLSGGGHDAQPSKILERTGMEYRVVRRHQNPVAGSLNRLAQLGGCFARRPVRWSTPAYDRGRSVGAADHHDLFSPMATEHFKGRSAARLQAAATGPDADGGWCERLGAGDGDGALAGSERIAAVLRELWERPGDLGARQS